MFNRPPAHGNPDSPPYGWIVERLMEQGFNFYAINPKQLARFRDRFSPAGAKDDSRDAWVLCDAIHTDPRCFPTILSLDPVLGELREWSRIAQELRHDRNRLSNRVRELLWRYYPQLLELTEDVGAPKVPRTLAPRATPAKAKGIRETAIAKLLTRYRIPADDRRPDTGKAAGYRQFGCPWDDQRSDRTPRSGCHAPRSRQPPDYQRGLDDFVDTLAHHIAALPAGVAKAAKRVLPPPDLGAGFACEQAEWSRLFAEPTAELLIRGGLERCAQTVDGEKRLEEILRSLSP